MKTKFGICIILAFVVCMCGVGIYSLTSSKKNEENKSVKVEKNYTTLRSQVYSGQLENTICMQGTVIDQAEQLFVLSEETGNGEKVTLKKGLREEVSKGETIFYIGSNKYDSEVNGLIVELNQDEDKVEVKILDYDSLTICASIDYGYIDKIKIGSDLSLKSVNSVSQDGKFFEKVKNIGYIVDDNMIDVYVSNDRNYLPGTMVELTFTYFDEMNSCYVLKQMVETDVSGSYVYIEKEGEREKRSIVTGREFEIVNDDMVSQYIEVVSGVEEGERLVVDVIQ